MQQDRVSRVVASYLSSVTPALSGNFLIHVSVVSFELWFYTVTIDSRLVLNCTLQLLSFLAYCCLLHIYSRMILSSLCTSLAVSEAIAGHRFLTKDNILPVCKISDTVRDEEKADIHRVEKYSEKNAWLPVLNRFCLFCLRKK